jgi:exonuclease III
VDIAMLQESKLLENKFENYNFQFNALPVRENWGNTILYKKYNAYRHALNSSFLGSSALMVYDFILPNNEVITIINVYGQIDYDGYATTTMHHVISDISALVYKNLKSKYILMAGDLNISTQYDEQYRNQAPSHNIVFDRIKDLGLINCTMEKYGKHIQTYYHSKGDFPWQNDYIFTNKKLYDKINSLKIYSKEEIDDRSDHMPVEIEFEP